MPNPDISPGDLTNEQLLNAHDGAENILGQYQDIGLPRPAWEQRAKELRAEVLRRMQTPIALAGKLLVRGHLAHNHAHGEPLEGCLICRNRRRESPAEFDRITGDPVTWEAFKAEALQNAH